MCPNLLSCSFAFLFGMNNHHCQPPGIFLQLSAIRPIGQPIGSKDDPHHLGMSLRSIFQKVGDPLRIGDGFCSPLESSGFSPQLP